MFEEVKRWNAAGTWDILERPDFPYDRYVHKTITVNEITGNIEAWRPWGTGIVNNVGLVNPGLKEFQDRILPQLKEVKVPVTVSILGDSLIDWARLAAGVGTDVELNLSCPNFGKGIYSADETYKIIEAVKDATDKEVSVKLAVYSSPSLAKACEYAGADRLVLSNSLKTPLGALSGSPLKSLSLELVKRVAPFVEIPIVGCGGIYNEFDVWDYVAAGATDVALGSVNLL